MHQLDLQRAKDVQDIHGPQLHLRTLSDAPFQRHLRQTKYLRCQVRVHLLALNVQQVVQLQTNLPCLHTFELRCAHAMQPKQLLNLQQIAQLTAAALDRVGAYEAPVG